MNTQAVPNVMPDSPAEMTSLARAVRTLALVPSRRDCHTRNGEVPDRSIRTRPLSATQHSALQQVIDAVPYQVFILEPDFSNCRDNQASTEYFAPATQATLWERIEEFSHPEEADQQLAAYRDARTSAKPFSHRWRLRGNDGTYRWFLVTLQPMRDEQGFIARWCGLRIDIHDQMQALENSTRENVALREEIDRSSMFEEIVGTAPALQRTLARIAKVAPTDCTVLVTGETGTGKELVARAIHKRSGRASRPFISVNCAAIPKDLIASELFGHEKGAFTGALQRRIGRFELAEGGTLFLDEVGELSAETQATLLRVLQEREFQRVGGTATIRTNVRLICATHRDLPASIAAHSFRSDLFYRINVFPIEVPPLRDRPEDIRLLVQYFIERYASKMGKTIRSIQTKTMDSLRAYAWPGNVRELQNVIERSMIVCDSDEFSVDQSWLSRPAVPGQAMAGKLISQERRMIEDALTVTGGRIFGPTGAAIRLGMKATTLDSRIKALGIDKRRFRS